MSENCNLIEFYGYAIAQWLITCTLLKIRIKVWRASALITVYYTIALTINTEAMDTAGNVGELCNKRKPFAELV